MIEQTIRRLYIDTIKDAKIIEDIEKNDTEHLLKKVFELPEEHFAVYEYNRIYPYTKERWLGENVSK